MNWKEYLENLEKGLYANEIEYMNLNPKGEIGQNDQLFQVLKYFRKDMTNEDICEILLQDSISHAYMKPDTGAIKRLIKKNLGFEFVKVKATVRELFGCESPLEGESGKVIILMGSQIEIFDADEKKFYGCHAINYANKISGYWRAN